MTRARIARYAVDSAGNVQALKAVTVTKIDGSAFDQVMYDAPSGGSVISSPATNPEGVFEAWAPLGQRVKVLVSGDSAAVNGGFMPDEANIIVKDDTTGRVTLPARLTISTEGLVVTLGGATVTAGGLAVTAGGLSVADGGASIIQNSAGVYALDVRQVNAANLIQRWRDSGGNTTFLMTNTGLFTASATAGIAMGTGLSNNRLAIFHATSGLGAGDDYILSDLQLTDVNNSNGDHAVGRFVGKVITGDSGMRAGEFHVARPTGKTAAYGFNAATFGVHSMTPGGSDTANNNLGIYILADTVDWAGNVGAGIPQDAGVLVHAFYDGFNDYFRAIGKVGVGNPEHFRVAGGFRSGDLAGDVVSLNRFRAGNGTAALPSHTFDGDLDTGIYHSAANVIGFSTNGVAKLLLTSAGLLDFLGGGAVNVLNGGGAAPTLGTIGGTGPGVAAQNSWFKILLGGNSYFIPVWI